MKAVFAIDPGPIESAYLVWKGGRVECGMMRDNNDIVQLIRQGSHRDCDILAIEMIACYGMPVGKETFETCLWIGRFIEANAVNALHNPRHRLVYRKDVKMHLCGSMKAKDGNIRCALIDRFGGKEKAIGKKANPGPLYGVSGHLWSALAIAVTVMDNNTHETRNLEANQRV